MNDSTTTTQQPVRPGDARRDRMAQNFANIIAVLMRDPGFRSLRLADLEWLVVPAVLSGQFRLAHGQVAPPGGQNAESLGAANQSGMLIPVAVALWASVSPAIDKRLSDNLDQPLMLRPNEWASGDHLWLIALGGNKQAVPTFLKQLEKDEFKGRQVKMRASGPDGKVIIKSLNPPN